MRFDRTVDTNKRPTAPLKECWSYDSSTMGDMHANAEGLLWRAEFEGIITTTVKDANGIDDTFYAELAHISDEYYHYTHQLKQYGHPYITQDCKEILENRDKKKQSIDEYLDKYIQEEFKEKNKKEKPTSIIYTYTDDKNQLCYKVRIPPEGTIVSHKNIIPKNSNHLTSDDFINAAITEGHIPPHPADGLNKNKFALEQWRKQCAPLNNRLKHAKLRFDKILSKIQLTPNLPDDFLLYLIGDTISDRGPSDELMFKVFKKLQILAIEKLKERVERLSKAQSKNPTKKRANRIANIKKKLKEQTFRFFKINLSNHDTSFLKWYLKFQKTGDYSFSSNISSQQTTSLKNICLQLEQGLITPQELKQWIEEDYLPHLELFSYSENYNKTGEEEFIVRTHAPSPKGVFETVTAITQHYGYGYDYDNAKKDKNKKINYPENKKFFRENIDIVNQYFQKELKTAEGLQRYIDDYEWHMLIGNIQTISHMIDEIRLGYNITQEEFLFSKMSDKNMHLLFKLMDEILFTINNIENDHKENSANNEENTPDSRSTLTKRWMDTDTPEKTFFNRCYNAIKTCDTTYKSEIEKNKKEALQNIKKSVGLKAFHFILQNCHFAFTQSILPEKTPCPYYWMTNNRWIPQEMKESNSLSPDPIHWSHHDSERHIPQRTDKQTNEDPYPETGRDVLSDNTTILCQYGHIGENKEDSNNLDTHFFQNAQKKHTQNEQFYRSNRSCTLQQNRQYYHYLIKKFENMNVGNIPSLCGENTEYEKKYRTIYEQAYELKIHLKNTKSATNIEEFEKNFENFESFSFIEKNGDEQPEASEQQNQPVIPYLLTTTIQLNKNYLNQCTELYNILQNTVSQFLEKEAKLNNSKKLLGKGPGQSKKREALDKISDNLWRKEIQLREHIAKVEATIRSPKNKQSAILSEMSICPLDLKQMAADSVQLLDENKSFLQKNKNLFDIPRKALCWFLSHTLCMLSKDKPSQQTYDSYAVLFHKAGETHSNLVRQEAKNALNKVKLWKGLPGPLDNVGGKGVQKNQGQNENTHLNDSTVK